MARGSKKEPSQSERMSVRFFFKLSISYLIPRNPHSRRSDRDSVTNASWEQSWTNAATLDLAEALKPRGFDVAYRAHQLVDKEHRLYVVHFAVSAAKDFDVQGASVKRKGHPRYSLPPGAAARTKSQFETEIRITLEGRWVVNAISHSYFAAWHFTYGVRMEGVLALRRVLGQGDIAGAGGSVRDAIEFFNSEVVDSLRSLGFSAYPRDTARRPKDNIYRFDVHSVQHFCLSEDDVCGDLSLMTRNMSARDFPYVELKSPRESFSGPVGDTLAMLKCHDYPESADVVSATLALGDVDEDVHEHVDFLTF